MGAKALTIGWVSSACRGGKSKNNNQACEIEQQGENKIEMYGKIWEGGKKLSDIVHGIQSPQIIVERVEEWRNQADNHRVYP